jgi:integrase
MGRKRTGAVIERTRGTETTYALRFSARGKRRYQTLGTEAEGWSPAKAQAELTLVLAAVERGTWQPPSSTPALEPEAEPNFHEFASQWFEARRGEWRDTTEDCYRSLLGGHLLPFFARYRLSEITVCQVDDYREFKVAAFTQAKAALEAWKAKPPASRGPRPPHPFGPASINKTITLCAQILDVAEERELLTRNPFRVNPRRRKARVSKPAPVWLDRADHIAALIDAAGELDREAPVGKRHIPRSSILATFLFGGLRIGELVGLRWRDVDLAAGTLLVGRAKTPAGIRRVDVLPALRDELAVWKASAKRTAPDDFVYGAATGGRMSEHNLRTRVFDKAVKRADERLIERDQTPLPSKLTPHRARHSYASLLVALGEDPAYIMGQLGHSDPGFTLRIYTHAMRRGQDEKDRLRALVNGETLPTEAEITAPNGTSTVETLTQQVG